MACHGHGRAGGQGGKCVAAAVMPRESNARQAPGAERLYAREEKWSVLFDWVLAKSGKGGTTGHDNKKPSLTNCS
ncbi:hypothetical protein ZWY2020_035819 [Hordeum vulgare]|nr:hypothetical protein ZWY2020_035819 [Hordeum vulgare]